MKKSIFLTTFLGIATIASSLGSCGDDKDTPNNTSTNTTTVIVTLAPESLTTGPEAANLEFTVTANADWSVRTDADWITLRPSGGIKDTPSAVKASVTANTGLDTRSAEINVVSGGNIVKTLILSQGYELKASLSDTSLTFGAQESSSSVTVTANTDWEMTASESWISLSPAKGTKGDTEVTVKVSGNDSDARQGNVTLKYGDSTIEMKVSQLSDEVMAPEGYTLVWSDEFNESSIPSSDWVHENWNAGYVNNELQTYTSKEIDGKRTTEIKDGFLHINCFKGSDGKIYSGRINAKPNTGWLYGYFEARINLPKGKGTWPAFWMMPCNVDWSKNPWPYCGEIDIMEEVGADPNQVSSSLHTGNYNHTKGNQPTHAMNCPGAEGEFHVYAIEWTEDAITTYVDGNVQLRANRSEMGTDHDSWPFHYAFYPILNLAWGGDWGGYKGVDESALPVTMKVDYVRIFQKR
ncbi:MAG: family 16 glycosylhydrolase [Bacteroides sp.]|nr:family 16 glycosylhydrolase [Bacteroides sp.]